MRRKRIAGFGVAAMLGIALLGCPSPDEAPPPEAPPPAEPGEPEARPDHPELPPGVTAEMVSTGEEMFRGRANCYTCHGMDGTGTALGPDLTDGRWINIAGRDMDQIEQNIRNGVSRPVEYPAPMPPMGGARLDDDEIRAVAAYVYVISEP